RPVNRSERFELFKCAFLFEHLGVSLKRDGRIEHARHAIDADLAGEGMGRRIGPQEVARFARRRRLTQCIAIWRGLDDRHYVQIGLESGAQPMGARLDEMVGRDGATDLRFCTVDEIDALLGREMLKRHPQARDILVRGMRVRSMKTFSRSKMSTSGSTTSPCM